MPDGSEIREETADELTDESVDQAFEEGREAAGDELPSQGLLSFYDRLRSRIESHAAERAGEKTAEILLLVPDVFVFLLRLMLDPEVPRAKRALIGSAIAYFVLPVDLLPEAMIGPGGYLDDLVLALAVLSQSFGSDLEPFARKYWSGSQSLRKVIRDVLQSAHGLLGTDLHGRLRKALAKRGIDLDEAEVVDLESANGEEDRDRPDDESDEGDGGFDDPYADPYEKVAEEDEPSEPLPA